MSPSPRFVRDPESPTRKLAKALATADHELHAALIHARIEAGMSQKDVADALGISQATVSQFERYDNDPHLSTVRRYALAVGASVSHQVALADGRRVECGEWHLPWATADSFPGSYHVTPGALRGTLQVGAPGSVTNDFGTAA